MIPDDYKFKSSKATLEAFFEKSTIWRDIVAALQYAIEKGHNEIAETMIEGPELFKARGKLGILKYLTKDFPQDLLEAKIDQIEEQNEEEKEDGERDPDSYIESGEWTEA